MIAPGQPAVELVDTGDLAGGCGARSTWETRTSGGRGCSTIWRRPPPPVRLLPETRRRLPPRQSGQYASLALDVGAAGAGRVAAGPVVQMQTKGLQESV